MTAELALHVVDYSSPLVFSWYNQPTNQPTAATRDTADASRELRQWADELARLQRMRMYLVALRDAVQRSIRAHQLIIEVPGVPRLSGLVSVMSLAC